MFWQRIQKIIAIRQVAAGVMGLTFGLILSVIGNWLYDSGTSVLPIIIGIFLVLLLVNILLWIRQRYEIRLNLEVPKVLRTDFEKFDEAREGLIAVVSLYSPNRGHAFKVMKPSEWLPLAHKAAEDRDYALLDFPHSNIMPTIEAVKTHSRRLKHCWLIGTAGKDENVAGSNLYIPALIDHLKSDPALKNCDFHFGDQYDVNLVDDSLVFNRTLRLMKAIFKEASQDYALANKQIIADFTSGIRSISLGIILSCLDRDHDVQMIGTHYDEQGQFTDELFPIVFGFEPVLEAK